MRIYRDDLPTKKVGGWRYFLQVIRHLVAPMPHRDAIRRDHLQKLASEPRDAAVQIVLVGALDLRRDDLADLQRATAGEVDGAVNLRRVGL